MSNKISHPKIQDKGLKCPSQVFQLAHSQCGISNFDM